MIPGSAIRQTPRLMKTNEKIPTETTVTDNVTFGLKAPDWRG
jgi:hypothetical protein